MTDQGQHRYLIDVGQTDYPDERLDDFVRRAAQGLAFRLHQPGDGSTHDATVTVHRQYPDGSTRQVGRIRHGARGGV